MSLTPSDLKNKTKKELQEIAQDLGLTARGLRNELEQRIKAHLRRKNPELTSESDSQEITPRRSIRQRNLNDVDLGPTSNDSDDNPLKSNELEINEMIIAETVQTQTDKNTNGLSSQQEDQETPRITDQVINSFKFLLSVEKAKDFIFNLRTNLSSPRACLQTIIFIEFLVFIYHAIEWNYEIITISTPSLFVERANVYIFYAPDITFLIDWHRFWRPLVYFLFYLLLLPLGISLMINFEPQHHTYSPLVFSAAKYGIFLISSGNFEWAEDIREIIPDNLIYAGAGAGVILSLYETVLRK